MRGNGRVRAVAGSEGPRGIREKLQLYNYMWRLACLTEIERPVHGNRLTKASRIWWCGARAERAVERSVSVG
jgi:hypothetical protein